MSRIWTAVMAVAAAAVLLAGCSVKVNVDGHETGVDVKGPDIQINVPERNPGNPGTVPVNVTLPADAKSIDLSLGHAVGNVRLDGSGSAALAGDIGYWKVAPAVTSNLSGDRLVIDVPAENQVSNVGGHIPDTVLHVGARVPVRMDVDAGVGEMTLNLREIPVTELTLHMGVGRVTVNVPARANVRVHYKAGVGSNNLQAAGFTRNGDTWLSPGFKDDHVLELTVDAGVGEFRIER